ncbi:hypothetical protein CL614_08540 [archaeon]|nr:hypothetical protein [archaeon]
MDNLEDLIEEALKNIRKDRGNANVALVDIMKYLMKTERSHMDLGQQFTKYTEISQKSNDQLIKVLSIMKKGDKDFDGFADDEKEAIFEEIQEIAASSEESQDDAETD